MSLLGSKSAKKKDAKAAAKVAAKATPKALASKAAAPTRGVVVEKPKANIYTVLLALSFVAILVGCLCLYLEIKAYDFAFKARL